MTQQTTPNQYEILDYFEAVVIPQLYDTSKVIVKDCSVDAYHGEASLHKSDFKFKIDRWGGVIVSYQVIVNNIPQSGKRHVNLNLVADWLNTKETQAMTTDAIPQPETPSQANLIPDLESMIDLMLETEKEAAKLNQAVGEIESNNPVLRMELELLNKLQAQVIIQKEVVAQIEAKLREQNSVIYHLAESTNEKHTRLQTIAGNALASGKRAGWLTGKPSALQVGKYQLATRFGGYEVTDAKAFYYELQDRGYFNHVTLTVKLGNKDAGISRSDVHDLLEKWQADSPDKPIMGVEQKPDQILSIGLALPDSEE